MNSCSRCSLSSQYVRLKMEAREQHNILSNQQADGECGQAERDYYYLSSRLSRGVSSGRCECYYYYLSSVIIIIYGLGRLERMRMSQPPFTTWSRPSRDDGNVPTTIHNPQTVHGAIANTRFCGKKKASTLTLSDSRSLCDLRHNEISAMDGLAHPQNPTLVDDGQEEKSG